jgi:hypothetical protein
MQRVYQRSRKAYLLVPVLLVLYVMLGLVFIGDSFPSESAPYKLLFILAAFLALVSIVEICRAIERKIIITEDGIEIRKPFDGKYFRWEEIVEFSRFRKRSGPYYVAWHYYLRSLKTGEKRHLIETESFSEIMAVVATIFQRANNARFVTLYHTSIIPFHRDIKSDKWEFNELLEV